jgi:hypothetical protein
VELAAVVLAIGKNKSIKHLNLGRNLAAMKAKNAAVVMEAVVQMIQVCKTNLIFLTYVFYTCLYLMYLPI